MSCRVIASEICDIEDGELESRETKHATFGAWEVERRKFLCEARIGWMDGLVSYLIGLPLPGFGSD